MGDNGGVTHPLTRSALALTATGAGALAYAGVVERQLYTLRRWTLPVLPEGARPLRVLQVSDIHFVPGQERKARWIRDLAGLRPDLVVDTGDNLSHERAVPGVLDALRPLLELPGAFVMGSNDYYAPAPKNPARYLTPRYGEAPRTRVELPTHELRDGMLAGGWADLDNARTTLQVGDLALDLVGVDDPHIGRDRYDDVAGPRADGADVLLGVAHAPYQRVLDAMHADGASLVLAGHTHGGQLCVPGYGALVTNCDLDRRRAKGVSRWWPGAADRPDAEAPQDASWLHVSAGLGTSRFAPVRFACRPEASLLTLVPAVGRAA